MEWTISRKAWFVRFYLWLYQADSTNMNLCKLFWGLFWAPLALTLLVLYEFFSALIIVFFLLVLPLGSLVGSLAGLMSILLGRSGIEFLILAFLLLLLYPTSLLFGKQLEAKMLESKKGVFLVGGITRLSVKAFNLLFLVGLLLPVKLLLLIFSVLGFLTKGVPANKITSLGQVAVLYVQAQKSHFCPRIRLVDN